MVLQIENNKSLVCAIVTSLIKKFNSPNQDVRLHRTDFTNGYSARSLDTKVTAPFFKDKFPSMPIKKVLF
jgi:DNA (cytosine-5)-methyltransferase 1